MGFKAREALPFSFADSSAIKTKQTTWEERDKAEKDGEDKLNNKNIGNYSADMRQGIITKIAVTPANVND